jgi:hypothetical protein
MTINDNKHLQTFGGGPEGGYALRFGRWHEWRREWGERAVYRAILPSLKPIFKNENGSWMMRIVPREHEVQDEEMEYGGLPRDFRDDDPTAPPIPITENPPNPPPSETTP